MAAGIVQSLVDRLIDDDPNGGSIALETEEQEIARYKTALRRDLEALLNTNRPWLPYADRFDGLDKTVIGFGIPDLSTEDMSVPAVRERVRHTIANVIRDHEPRLSDFDIEMDEAPTSRGLRLRISAVLSISRSDEMVVYEASVHPGDRTIEVDLTG